MQKCIRERQLTDKAIRVVSQHVSRAKMEGRAVDRREVCNDLAKVRFKEPPPQRLLVSLMKSDSLICTTPLLKWYREHGLSITLLEFIEYKPKKAFLPFVKMVTKARQEGNPVVAKTMKILGNSGE